MLKSHTSRARKPGLRRLLAPLAGAALIAAAAPAAHASESLSITVPAGIVEEQPTTIDVAVTADAPGFVALYAQPAGEGPCAPTLLEEGARDSELAVRLAGDNVEPGTSTLSLHGAFPQAGPQLVCAYLAHPRTPLSWNDPVTRQTASADAVVAEHPATVSVALGAPLAFGQPLVLDMTGTGAAGRVAFANVLAGVQAQRPCGIPDGLDLSLAPGAPAALRVDVAGGPFSGRLSLPPRLYEPGTPYRVCAYVGESLFDRTAEAIGVLDFATAPAPAASPSVVAPAPDRQKPVLTRLTASRTELAFDLTESGRVGLRAERAVTGVRTKAGRCVAATARKGRTTRRPRACVRYVAAARVTLTGTAGRTTVKLDGRLGGKRLAAGRYRVTATPVDGAGNVGAAVSATLRIPAAHR